MLNRLSEPWKGFAEPVLIEFPRGTSTSQMASILAERGVIEHPWLFLAAKILRHGARLQAGEYQFTKAASPLDVYGRIHAAISSIWNCWYPKASTCSRWLTR